MKKIWLVLSVIVLVNTQAQTSSACKLTVLQSPDGMVKINSSIEIYPTVFSTPVDNLKTQIFTIFKAEPIEGCTQIKQPQISKNSDALSNPYIVVVDGDAGFCGFKRRISMAKQVGAKGIIIMSQNLQYAIDPYGQYSDKSFFVFIAKPEAAKKLLQPKTFIVASITSSNSKNNQTKLDVQFWVSTIDKKSYELLIIWNETLSEIPAIAQRVKWRPRFALWGCNSGLFNAQTSCLENSNYISYCACGGQFCSPQTNFKPGDAIVKQDVRQKVIFQDHTDKYLQYILGFQKYCLNQFRKQLFSQSCAINIMMNLQINYTLVQRKIDNFIESCNNDLYQSLLLDRNRFSQIGSYPSVLLNRQNIKYSSKRDFQNQICKKLSLDKQEGCAKASRINIIMNITVNILFYILLIGGIAAIVFVLVYVYRKKIRKQMHKEMKMQVSASVQHYFALTQTK